MNSWFRTNGLQFQMVVALVALLSGPAAMGQSGSIRLVETSDLDFTLTSGDGNQKYIVEANSAGVCLFDFDRDGLLDIFLVNGGRLDSFRSNTPSDLKHAFYRNLGDRQFTNVTSQTKTGGNGHWGMGCSVVDYDADGRLDLYVTTYGPNLLLRNNLDGTFEDMASQVGVQDLRWSTGSSWADFDRDGDLDLFVANYIELDRQDLPEPGSPRYGSMGGVGLGCQFMGLPVMCGPRGLKGAGDALFENKGGGRFEEVAKKAGVSDEPGYFGLASTWVDLDQDGWIDLYVANDSTPNYLYQNNRDGTFSEIGLLSGVAVSEQGAEQAGMGLAIGDYLNSGRPAIYVTNFSEEYNTLYRNDGDFIFTDVTSRAGLARPSLPFVGWGATFADLDLDGQLDLFVANGHVFPSVDQLESESTRGYRQRNSLFQNQGGGRFVETALKAGLKAESVSRGSAVGDLDNDGLLDIVVANIGARPTIVWNETQTDNHYLGIELVARENTPGIGARVRVRIGDQWQSREIRSGSSYLSQDELRAYFGLGTAGQVDQIEVVWPDGKRTIMGSTPADQVLVIRKNSSQDQADGR